jgi:hypothetical protein
VTTAPRFTVLLPTHNRADVVGLAIESVLAQTEPDFELFVVGDGCTDATSRVVGSFGDPRIRWFDLPKAPGFGYANRNIALRQATGELVAFMAHDDLMLADHLALMARPFESPAVDWAYSRPLWVTDDGYIIPFAVDLRVPGELESFLTQVNSIPASCVVYRRAIHDRAGYWSDELRDAADWDLWKRMLAPGAGSKLAYVRQPTILHFRADWRSVAKWGPPPLAAWEDAARRLPWPAAATFAIADALPQVAVAKQIGGADAQRSLREGVEQALDLLAWTQAHQIAEMERDSVPRRSFDDVAADLTQIRFALRTMPFRRLVALQRRIQVRLGLNPVQHVGAVSPTDYLAANPDVQASGMDPLEHYYVHGMLEGRPTR